MIRKARLEDTEAIWAFLDSRRATSMFLSGNLKDHGINSTGHPKSNTVWLGIEDQRVSAVFGLTEFGYLVFEVPDFRANWAADLRKHLAGHTVRGMNGTWEQFEIVRAALGLERVTGPFDVRQPHYHLSLPKLLVPSGDTHLRDFRDEDLPFLRDWRFRANLEVMSVPDTDETRSLAFRYAKELVCNGRGRLLTAQGQPVAMTALNAVAGSCVQVGSVFTPRDLRGRGYARRAVALHLEEVRQSGMKEAILFAANQPAARAYEAIGFRQIGDYGIVDFSAPQTVAVHTEGKT